MGSWEFEEFELKFGLDAESTTVGLEGVVVSEVAVFVAEVRADVTVVAVLLIKLASSSTDTFFCSCNVASFFFPKLPIFRNETGKIFDKTGNFGFFNNVRNYITVPSCD